MVQIQLIYVTEVLYNVIIGCIKLSILLFYSRLFPTERFRKVSLLVAALIVAWFLACTIVSIFECVPIDTFWEPKSERRCVNLKQYILSNAVINIVTDLLLLILPLPMIWSLHLATERKVLVSGVFLLGLL